MEKIFWTSVKTFTVDFEQMRFIREKLERFGLLQSKNEEINDNNLKEID